MASPIHVLTFVVPSSSSGFPLSFQQRKFHSIVYRNKTTHINTTHNIATHGITTHNKTTHIKSFLEKSSSSRRSSDPVSFVSFANRGKHSFAVNRGKKLNQEECSFFSVKSQAMEGSSPATGSGGGTLVREVLEKQGRGKLDYTSDRNFYSFPRLVTHVDDGFLQTLTKLYRERLTPDTKVLDLMSSWVSHLPPEVQLKQVVGHGMNAAELLKNPRLDEFFVKDLNEDQSFAFDDQSFDAVICTVSVQYLQYPEKVFAEIYRILRPGGVCIISFSNRMFYDKAITAWRDTSGYGRIQLVKQYFQCVRGFTEPEVVKEVSDSKKPPGSNELPGPLNFFVNVGKLFQRSAGDPFYAVVSYRNFKPLP